MPRRKTGGLPPAKRKRVQAMQLSESANDDIYTWLTYFQPEQMEAASQELHLADDPPLNRKSILDKGTVWSYIDNAFSTRFDNLNIDYDATPVDAGMKRVYVTSNKFTKAFKITYSDSDSIVPEEYLKKWKSKQDQWRICKFMNIIQKFVKPLVRGTKSWYHSRLEEVTCALKESGKIFSELFVEEENGDDIPCQDKKCSSCSQTHDSEGRREVTDECGHKRCATCVYNSKECPTCRDKKCPSCLLHYGGGRVEVIVKCGHKRCIVCVLKSKKCPLCEGKTCPSCSQTHDLDRRREVTDKCGHKRCATCVYNSKECPMCRDEASKLSEEEKRLANSLGYNLQAALCCGMRHSKGLRFVAGLLEAAAEVCFGGEFFNKVLVEAVGPTAGNREGFPLTRRPHHWMADGQREIGTPSKKASDSASDAASDVPSSASLATPSSSEMDISVDGRAYVHPDVVVKSRIRPDFPRYLLVCQINLGEEIDVPHLVYQEMVGAGILQNEVFGLSINQDKACILKMAVSPQTGEISFVRRQKFNFAFEMDSDPTFDCEQFHGFFIALIALLDYASANISKANYKDEP